MRRLGFALLGLVLGLAFCGHAAALAQSTPIQLQVTPNRPVHFYSDPKGAMATARELVASGDLSGAIKGLSTYVAAHGNEADPARLLGDLYYRAGDLKKAEETYRAILRNYPHDRQTHNRLGTVLATENRVDDAISEFNASLPGTDSVGDLVALHQRKGDLAQYERGLKDMASRYPSDAGIQSEVGELYEALHQPDIAAQAFQRALASDPNSLTALNGLGMAQMDLHDYAAALEAFRRCKLINPASYACNDNIGAVFLEMKRFDDAQKALDRAHGLAPEMPQALVNFGYLADSRNQWRDAVTWYVKALSLSPFSTDAYIDLGIEYRDHQLFPQAEAVLIKGIAVAPEDGRLHEILGEVYQAMKKNDLAAIQFRLAAACLDPTVAVIGRAHLEALGAVAPKEIVPPKDATKPPR